MAKLYKINRRLLSYEEKLERVTFYNECPSYLRNGPKMDVKEFTDRVIYDETVTLICNKCGMKHEEDLELIEEMFGDDIPEMECMFCNKGIMKPEINK